MKMIKAVFFLALGFVFVNAEWPGELDVVQVFYSPIAPSTEYRVLFTDTTAELTNIPTQKWYIFSPLGTNSDPKGVLSILLSAQATGKRIKVYITSDTTGGYKHFDRIAVVP